MNLLGVSGTIKNDSPVDQELYNKVMVELTQARTLLQQAYQVVRQQRDLIEQLKQEIERGRNTGNAPQQTEVPTG